ncbi:hypothetical protein BJ684DRAFT_21091 [Piptocephalis cylindrospora]|uniref:Uncharacterized protein n=1 Tax=Piptocephalis cylindrospora TaxID=1907219 RepID=A0A4P9Y0T1_9FUNG|nr:hypothetical protein BJ684DRAFT_21091 [Piptocephalis cylindrospora]|eukprot:RKP12358.1 hypothetical protein BJ684DRAFT_21091 [Piptocephalis cylindrospora]
MSYDPIKDLAERQPPKPSPYRGDPVRMEKLIRRVERTARPPPWTRWSQLLGYALGFGVTVYSVLYYDPGYTHHCYTPIRRWVAKKKEEFWTLDAEDEQELEEQGRVW